MKKLLLLLFLLATVLSVPMVASARVVLFENFSSGQLSPSWQTSLMNGGTAAVVDFDGNKVLKMTGAGVAVIGDLTWTDYTVEGDIYVFDSSYWAYAAGILFRGNGGDYKNLLADAYIFQGRPNQLQLEKWTSSGRVPYPFNDYNHPFKPKVWQHFKIVCDGRHFQFYLDDVLTQEFVDTNAHLAGQVGFRTWAAGAYFDNLLVTDKIQLDTTPPVVIAPPDVITEATGVLTAVSIGTATAIDAVGVVSLTNDAPTSFPAETTMVTWTAKDAAGNAGKGIQKVTVQDTKAPVVIAPADLIVEATGLRTSVAIGTAQATDAVGVVSLTNNALASYTVGTTIITWSAKDTAGNLGTATQFVTIKDTTPPVVIAPADVTAEATGLQTAVVIGNAAATDAVGIASLTNNAPATFPIGTTVVTWTAKDAAGNSASANQKVIVRDSTLPVITGAVTTSPNINGWYNVNATVHFTATDTGSGLATVTPDVVLSADGAAQSVTGTATDKAGNNGSYTVNGINIDKTAPVITITGIREGVLYNLNSVPSAAYTATDNLSGIASQNATLIGGSEKGVGKYTYTVTTSDKAGNTTTKSAIYTVSYNFSGFLPPVNRERSFNLGSTIPVKFRLTDSNGASITNAAATIILQKSAGSTSVGDIVKPVSSGGSNMDNFFRYDSGQYIYNLSTNGLSAGTWQIIVSLDDTTTKTVFITLD
ncbi:MAG TPA: HYR domain-containing protein [Desulfuromonadaceae bacterium]